MSIASPEAEKADAERLLSTGASGQLSHESKGSLP